MVWSPLVGWNRTLAGLSATVQSDGYSALNWRSCDWYWVNWPAALSVGSAVIHPLTVWPCTWYQPPFWLLCPVTWRTAPGAAVPSLAELTDAFWRMLRPSGLSTVRTPDAAPDDGLGLPAEVPPSWTGGLVAIPVGVPLPPQAASRDGQPMAERAATHDGSVTMNVAPWPSSDSTRMVPW